MLRNLKKKEILKNSSRNPRIRPATQRKRFQHKKKNKQNVLLAKKEKFAIQKTKGPRTKHNIDSRLNYAKIYTLLAQREERSMNKNKNGISSERKETEKNEVSISNAIVENFFASFLSCLWR